MSTKKINEEVKRFKTLLEYDFYQEIKDEPEYLEEDDNNINNVDTTDLNKVDEPSETEDNTPIDNEVASDEEVPTEPEPIETPPVVEPEETIEDDSVELDVTDLVNKSEEAINVSKEAEKNTEHLLNKLSDLENKLSNISNVIDKIDSLEKEIIKRNPTPTEKLELQSLSSFPYTQKLSDYWNDKQEHSNYDVGKEKEYILTQSEIDSTYSEPNIKNSFNIDNDYDEEDI